MTPTEKSYYREIARLATDVSAAALTLARNCRDGDGKRMAMTEDVQATLDNAIAKFQTFLAETTR